MSPTRPLDRIIAQCGSIILGKQRQIQMALACLLARGHLLIEDVPGVGKTILAQVLAKSLGLGFNRIQFTSDMLPADIIGVAIFERQSGKFRFQPGPIFSQVVFADEINRATPRAQSALLEAMEEQQVTVEGETRPLPHPFFVIATQNPQTQIGTFPLPESQLDRFMLRITLGYPDHGAERLLLEGEERRHLLEQLHPVGNPEQLITWQKQVERIHAAPALLDYLQALLRHTRESQNYQLGLSPRAGLALLHCAKGWAFIEGREFAVPEDLQAVLPGVAGHRLRLLSDGGEDPIRHLLAEVSIP